MDKKEIKRHCRNRNYYLAQVSLLKEEEKQIDILMSKPRAPKLEVIGAPAHNYESHIVDWIERKDRVNEELSGYLFFLDLIDKFFDSLQEPWKEIAWKNFVEGKPAKVLCKEFKVDRSTYYRQIERSCKKLVI